MAGSADHRGISLDLGASLPGARQRLCLRTRLHVSGQHDGGVRDRPITPGSPWQNGCAERLIGTLRRECLDQMVIFSEMYLRRTLSAYAAYYNQAHALGIIERCALASSRPTIWRHCRHSDLGGAASPIRPDMIFGKDSLPRISFLARDSRGGVR